MKFYKHPHLMEIIRASAENLHHWQLPYECMILIRLIKLA